MTRPRCLAGGKIGKQRIEDAGTLYPKRMETVDDEIRDLSIKSIRSGMGQRVRSVHFLLVC